MKSLEGGTVQLAFALVSSPCQTRAVEEPFLGDESASTLIEKGNVQVNHEKSTLPQQSVDEDYAKSLLPAHHQSSYDEDLEWKTDEESSFENFTKGTDLALGAQSLAKSKGPSSGVESTS